MSVSIHPSPSFVRGYRINPYKEGTEMKSNGIYITPSLSSYRINPYKEGTEMRSRSAVSASLTLSYRINPYKEGTEISVLRGTSRCASRLQN